MIWLKVVHFAAIGIWSAVLLMMPALCVRRTRMRRLDLLHSYQGFIRFLYVVVMSPAAFVAIGSGTALIFMRETFEPWFSVKLALVGAMAAAHILTGLIVLRLFDEGVTYPGWRAVLATSTSACVITGILVVVLAKPELPDLLPDAMGEPGALRPIVLDLIPSRR